jgi:hypothetical protein
MRQTFDVPTSSLENVPLMFEVLATFASTFNEGDIRYVNKSAQRSVQPHGALGVSNETLG